MAGASSREAAANRVHPSGQAAAEAFLRRAGVSREHGPGSGRAETSCHKGKAGEPLPGLPDRQPLPGPGHTAAGAGPLTGGGPCPPTGPRRPIPASLWLVVLGFLWGAVPGAVQAKDPEV